MKLGTLVFLFDQEGRVLLGMKKVGFGVGKWNGFGGKVLPNETKEDGAVREMQEESGLLINPAHLEAVSEIDFYFAGTHVFRVFVFFAKEWEGIEIETEEMRPQWFELADIPYHEMWVGDSKWIPLVLGGQKIRAKIDFDESGAELLDFSWEALV